MFNPREQALIIWFVIFIVYALSNKAVRSSIPNIIKSFFRLFRHTIFIITNLYIVFIFILMYSFNVLEDSVIKDYVVWIFSALYPLIFRVSTKYLEESIWKIIKETFKLSIIPMFIISEYTLSIWAELIIVPVLALISGLLVVSEKDKKYHQFKKLLNIILIVIGFIYIFVGIKGFITNLNDASKVDFWQKMFIDIIGIMLHFPLLFFLQYVSIYEQIIKRTKLKKRIQKFLAIWVIFFENKFHKNELLRSLRNYKLWRADTLEELKNCLNGDSMKS